MYGMDIVMFKAIFLVTDAIQTDESFLLIRSITCAIGRLRGQSHRFFEKFTQLYTKLEFINLQLVH